MWYSFIFPLFLFSFIASDRLKVKDLIAITSRISPLFDYTGTNAYACYLWEKNVSAILASVTGINGDSVDYNLNREKE